MAKHAKGKHVRPKHGAPVPSEGNEAVSSDEVEAGASEGVAEASFTEAASYDAADEGSQIEAFESSEGAEPAADGEDYTAASGEAFVSSSDILEDKKAKRKKIAKRVGITSLSVVGAVAALYLVGVAVFATHYMPNTHIDKMDLSLKTPEEVKSTFDTKVDDYAIKVKGNGLNIAITSDQAGIAIDSTKMTEAISDSQNPWKWPVEVFQEKDMTSTMTDSLSASALAEVVDAAVANVNAEAKDPVNAYIAYDPEQKAFDIIEEVPGTKLDREEVLADILVGAMSLQDQVIILDDDLIEPEIKADDKRLVSALGDANELIKANITLSLAGTEACTVSADDIYGWVSITPEFEAVLDEAAMTQWSEELASQFNTVGSTRTYTRPDGKVVTVSGGDYGWKVDKQSLASTIAESIMTGATGIVEMPVLQSGTGYTSIGGKDWGTRYMDVDISEQHARLYGDNGEIIWEADIVSGATSGGRATPYGVYDVNLKGRHVTLTGRDSAGNITYQTPVAYWMPFIANSIGFHDATWQSSFGGNRYRTGAGSHGCINLSLSKAEELYGLLQVGDVVVVHS